jgi:hypothetical protein
MPLGDDLAGSKCSDIPIGADTVLVKSSKKSKSAGEGTEGCYARNEEADPYDQPIKGEKGYITEVQISEA